MRGKEVVDAAGDEGEQEPSRLGPRIHPAMHAASRDDDRGTRACLEFLTCTVEAKSTLEDFEDLFAPLVVMQGWTGVGRNVGFDDGECPIDIGAVHPQCHLLAGHPVGPRQISA
jgi:hypothetical protein